MTSPSFSQMLDTSKRNAITFSSHFQPALTTPYASRFVRSSLPPHPPLSPKRLCRNVHLSLRATEGSVPARRSASLCRSVSHRQALRHAGVAIPVFSMPREIASVVSLPRNDITTQSLRGEGKDEGKMDYSKREERGTMSIPFSFIFGIISLRDLIVER